MAKVVLGYAPTRRNLFSAPEAVRYANLTRQRLRELGVEFVDIEDIASDGLLHDDNDRIRIAEKLKAAKVDVQFSGETFITPKYSTVRISITLKSPPTCPAPDR